MSSEKVSEIDSETIERIQERVLSEEKSQLHMKKPHNIIPEIRKIIEQEVDLEDEEVE